MKLKLILKDFKRKITGDFNTDMVLKLINHHSNLHNIGKFSDDGLLYMLTDKDKIKLNKMYGNDIDFYDNMIALNKADNYGRFYVEEANLEEKYLTLENFIPYNYFEKNKSNFPEAIILTGLPAVGKSTYIKELLKQKDYVILSSDDMIMEKYPKLSYSDAFAKVQNNDEFKWIEKELRERMIAAIKDRKNIIFDRTNLTPKMFMIL